MKQKKTFILLLIAISSNYLLSISTSFIQNKTTEDIEITFKYEGHGKTEERKIKLQANEQKEYDRSIPGCRLTTTTFSTVPNGTTNKQTVIIKDTYGNFDITFTNGFLTVSRANN